MPELRLGLQRHTSKSGMSKALSLELEMRVVREGLVSLMREAIFDRGGVEGQKAYFNVH